jgi:hypothetical protein
MCIIIPIDHTSCDHTIAIWQHCANAPRSVFGHKPCSHIRQHGRPIITRKKCHNCGGPRFFARRGGLAARGSGSGSGSSMLGQLKEKKEDSNEQYDSGYQSDLIPEADDEAEDDDPSLSPRQCAALTKRWMDFSRRSSNTPRFSGQKSNWRPNLKRDLSESSSESSMPSSRRMSIVSARQLPPSDAKWLDNSLAPAIRSPSPPRKGSTLLHPSPPLQESFERLSRTSAPSFQDLTPPATPPSRPDAPKRQSSTLLHPSPSHVASVAGAHEEPGFPFTFSLPVTSAPIPTSAPRRPDAPPRKNSTLLHPSPPSDEMFGPLAIPVKTVISLPPTPQATPTLGYFKRCLSVRSTPSDDDWEGPLHSSHSDAEYDSEDDQSVEAESAHRVSLKVAHLGRTAHASRVSFHGNQLRILRD